MSIYRLKTPSKTVNAVCWGPGNDDRLRALGWLDASDIRISSDADGLWLIVPGNDDRLALPEGWWVVRRAPLDFVTMSHEKFCQTYEALPDA